MWVFIWHCTKLTVIGNCDYILDMTVKIQFTTSGQNRLTAESMQQSIRKRLARFNIEYQERGQLPLVIEMTDRQFLLFSLVWGAELPYLEWRVIERGPQE
jgi:hypothetical protein